jgi:hypothetical protein
VTPVATLADTRGEAPDAGHVTRLCFYRNLGLPSSSSCGRSVKGTGYM